VTWAGFVVGETKNAYKILGGRTEGNRPFGRLSLDLRIILEWILGK
jgi:hypothetical protein